MYVDVKVDDQVDRVWAAFGNRVSELEARESNIKIKQTVY